MTNKQLQDFYKVDARKLARLKKQVDVLNPYEVKAKILSQNRRAPNWISGCPFSDEEADDFLVSVGSPGTPTMRVDQNDPPTSDMSLIDICESATNYEESRFNLQKARSLKVAHELEVAKGLYISKEEAEEDFFRAGSALKASILAMRGELPAVLEGLTAVQMKKKLKEYSVNMLLSLSETAKRYDDAEKAG
jgi:hypothetical protein